MGSANSRRNYENLCGTGITCNAICPGWVLTPLVQKQIDEIATAKNIPLQEAELELLSEKQPSKKMFSQKHIFILDVTKKCYKVTNI